MSRRLKKISQKKTSQIKKKPKLVKLLFIFGGFLLVVFGALMYLQQKQVALPTQRYSISDQGSINKVTTEKETWEQTSAAQVLKKKLSGEESTLLTQDAFSDWMIYEDSIQGFTFLYPQGFEIESTQPDIVLRLIKHQATITVTPTTTSIAVSIQYNNASEVQKDVLELAAKGIEQTFERFTPIDIKDNASRFQAP